MVEKIYGIGEFWANRTPALHLPGGRQLFVMTGSTLWTLDTASLQQSTLWKKKGWWRWWWQLELPTRHAKLQSECHHQQTNTQFFTGRMPFCHPTNSVKALKAGMYESSIMIAFSTLTLQDGRHKRHLITKNIAWVMPKVCLRKTSGGPRMCGDWEKRCKLSKSRDREREHNSNSLMPDSSVSSVSLAKRNNFGRCFSRLSYSSWHVYTHTQTCLNSVQPDWHSADVYLGQRGIPKHHDTRWQRELSIWYTIHHIFSEYKPQLFFQNSLGHGLLYKVA